MTHPRIARVGHPVVGGHRIRYDERRRRGGRAWHGPRPTPQRARLGGHKAPAVVGPYWKNFVVAAVENLNSENFCAIWL
jgi:hypothetical protein